jgi:hypothetical protein
VTGGDGSVAQMNAEGVYYLQPRDARSAASLGNEQHGIALKGAQKNLFWLSSKGFLA